jgi:hypothetical protein
VAGVYTNLFSANLGNYSAHVAGDVIEIRAIGSNQFEVYVNNVKRGTTQTVSDAAIVGAKHYAIVATEGGSINRFFAGSPRPFSIGFAGDSVIEPASSFAYLARDYLQREFLDLTVTFNNNARSGNWTWSNLVRVDALLATNPELVVFDGRPEDAEPHEAPAMEALIRRIWSAQPGCKLIYVAHQGVSDHNDNGSIFEDPLPSQANVDNALAICAHYGIPHIDDVPVIQALVSGGASLSDYYADAIHPTVAGQQVLFELLQPLLPFGGGSKPAVMPTYLHANAPDYENASIMIDGQSYAEKTGSWSNVDGGGVQSSEVGATITYTATCQSYGIKRDDTLSNTVQVSIDGGAFAALSVAHNGRSIPGGRGEHTITFKVVSTPVRIDEFWAI